VTHTINGEVFEVLWNGGPLLEEREQYSGAFVEPNHGNVTIPIPRPKKKKHLRGDSSWDRSHIR
jgi:hypothetical protein